ncbi:MAG: LacI family DNA-binding transcriptional regulator [Acidobacteriota bacterium]
MRRRAVSIQDIARTAGVSHATVSRALNNSRLISPDVRSRIQQLAAELDYTPNAVAQSLKEQRTKTIGLVVTSIADPFVGLVVRGIDEAAQAAGMSVFLSVSYNDPEREMAVIETFHRRRVDGVISAAAQISGRHRERLARVDVPTVLVNHQAEPASDLLYSVEVGDYDGARQAVAHLIELGHRAIGYLGASSRPRSNRRRFAGYRDALEAEGIRADETWVEIAPCEHRFHTDDVSAGRSLLPGLLRAGVSALFCYNDMVAIGALLACRDHGVAVPAQLSVVGFDDIEMAQYVVPPLTTMRQPKLRLGKLAMKMMLDLLDGRPVENHTLPTEFVLRSSTAAPLSRSTGRTMAAGARYPQQPEESDKCENTLPTI